MDALNEYPPAADPARAFGVRAEFAWRYWEHAEAELRARELWAIYEEIERPLVPVLALMERHGIRVDPARLEAFAKELERDLDNLTREIYQLAGERVHDRLAQAARADPLREAEAAADPENEDRLLDRRRRADRAGARASAPGEDPRAPEPREAQGHVRRHACPGSINPSTGRIHTTFNQLVASTGRLSSQDPNLMNIPIRTELGRRIRQAFIPEAGWQFVAADYSQIELRILAHLSEEPALDRVVRRGEDIHTRTASEVFKVPADSVTSLQRTIAKSANYAILYGVSAFGLSQATKIDQKEAQKYISDYFASHPRVRAFIDRTLAEGASAAT